jgi:curved DNA-binding protein CbpA
MLDKKNQALALLEKTEDLHPEQFCDLAFPITDEPSIISNKFRISDRFFLARTLLVLIIKRQGIPETSLKDKEKPNTETALLDPSSTKAQASSFKDYYAILGISPDASKQEIRSAFRKLMAQYHPDKLMHMDLTDDQINEMESKVRDLTEAWGVLDNDSKKQEYDKKWRKEEGGDKTEEPKRLKQSTDQEPINEEKPEVENFVATIIPTKSVSKKSKLEQAKVISFQEDVKNAGLIEKDIDMSKWFIEQKSLGQLPVEFKGIQMAEISIAAKLHSKGIEAVDVFKKTYDSKIFNDGSRI